MSPTSSVDANSSSSPAAPDRQFAIICSEKQARVTTIKSATFEVKTNKTRMWANAQRDGRPAEYMWRPLFNAAKFG